MRTASILRAAALSMVLLFASTAAFATRPFSADYNASYMGNSATGRMSIEPAGQGRWRYTMVIRNKLGDLRQSTVFEEVDGQLRPVSASDTTNVLIKRSKKDAVYDWQRGVATWTGDVKPDRKGPVKLQRGDLDALLVNLAIARDIAAGRPLKYRMVDDGRIKQMTYTLAGHEPITVNGRTVQATKAVSTSGDKKITVWVVPGMPVPARLMQVDGGSTIDLRIAG